MLWEWQVKSTAEFVYKMCFYGATSSEDITDTAYSLDEFP